MRVRVLGCSGAIARDCRTTAFLVDQDVLIDAGTGVGDLTREEMLRVQDVFLTHSHLDHVACLPLMVDTIAAARVGQPLRVHALPHTLAALRQHIFNDVIWPDFSRLPSAESPLVTFHPLEVGAVRHVQGRAIEVLPAEHSVPAVGYAVRGPQAGAPWWVFSGDTGPNPALWQRINQLPVAMLVIETAFSNHESALAQRSQHLAPHTLAQELAQLNPGRPCPIYITHTKPSETQLIEEQVRRLDAITHPASGAPHDISWLQAGQEFDV